MDDGDHLNSIPVMLLTYSPAHELLSTRMKKKKKKKKKLCLV